MRKKVIIAIVFFLSIHSLFAYTKDIPDGEWIYRGALISTDYSLVYLNGRYREKQVKHYKKMKVEYYKTETWKYDSEIKEYYLYSTSSRKSKAPKQIGEETSTSHIIRYITIEENEIEDSPEYSWGDYVSSEFSFEAGTPSSFQVETPTYKRVITSIYKVESYYLLSNGVKAEYGFYLDHRPSYIDKVWEDRISKTPIPLSISPEQINNLKDGTAIENLTVTNSFNSGFPTELLTIEAIDPESTSSISSFLSGIMKGSNSFFQKNVLTPLANLNKDTFTTGEISSYQTLFDNRSSAISTQSAPAGTGDTQRGTGASLFDTARQFFGNFFNRKSDSQNTSSETNRSHNRDSEEKDDQEKESKTAENEKNTNPVGDPVLVSSGSFVTSSRLFALPTGSFEEISFNRNYNSRKKQKGIFGVGWSSFLDQRVIWGAFALKENTLSHYETQKASAIQHYNDAKIALDDTRQESENAMASVNEAIRQYNSAISKLTTLKKDIYNPAGSGSGYYFSLKEEKTAASTLEGTLNGIISKINDTQDKLDTAYSKVTTAQGNWSSKDSLSTDLQGRAANAKEYGISAMVQYGKAGDKDQMDASQSAAETSEGYYSQVTDIVNAIPAVDAGERKTLTNQLSEIGDKESHTGGHYNSLNTQKGNISDPSTGYIAEAQGDQATAQAKMDLFYNPSKPSDTSTYYGQVQAMIDDIQGRINTINAENGLKAQIQSKINWSKVGGAGEQELAAIAIQRDDVIALWQDAYNREMYKQWTRNKNSHTVYSGDDYQYERAGEEILYYIDESGRQFLYTLQNSPDHSRSQNYGNGETNYYPSGTAAICEDPEAPGIRVDPSGDIVVTERNGLIRRFDFYGQLISLEDRNGNTLTINYNTNRCPAKVSEAAGQSFSLSYDANNHLSSITDDQTGKTTLFSIPDTGHLTSVTDTDGDTVQYEYDENRITKIIKPDGKFRQYHYIQHDGKWKADWTLDEEGNKETFQYFSGNTLYTNPSGDTTHHYFNSKGQDTRVVYGDGSEKRLVYDGNDFLSQENFYEPGGLLTLAVSYTNDTYGNRLSARYGDGSSESWQYNSYDQITKHTGRNGFVSSYTYDSKGNLTAVYLPDSSTPWRYRYNSRGELIESTDPAGRRTTFTRNSHGQLTAKSAPDGDYFYTWSPDGLLLSSHSPGGRSTEYTYTNSGRVLTETRKAGEESWTRTAAYNSRKDLISSEDFAGNITQMNYDGRHKRHSLLLPDNTEITSQYRADGKLTEEIFDGQYTTEYTYDKRSRLIKTNQKETGRYSEYSYNAIGQITAVTEGKEGGHTRTTRFEYDRAGQRTKIIYPDNTTRLFAYDKGGNIIKETDALGNQVEYEYDSRNRLIKATLPDNSERKYKYDALGRLSEADINGVRTRYTYTSEGYLQEKNYPDSHTAFYQPGGVSGDSVSDVKESWEYEWDGPLFKVSYTGPEGAESSTFYNLFNQPVKQINPDGGKINYSYDKNGNLTGLTDPLGNTQSWEYDTRNNTTAAIDPYGNRWEYGYDSRGLMTSQTNPLSQTNTFNFDEAGFLLSQTDPAGNTTRYEYDDFGNLSHYINALDETDEYLYDIMDRLVKEIDPIRHETRYAYDKNGNLTSFADPRAVELGKAISYQYNEMGLMKAETNLSGDTASYDYYPGGLLKQKTDFNGKTTRYAYSSDGQMTQSLYSNGTRNEYIYDKAGRLIESLTQENRQTYGYDISGRMTSQRDLTLNTGADYSYDLNGNKTGETRYPTEERVSYTYGSAGELLSLTDPTGGVTTYSYDSLLRETKKQSPNGWTEERSYNTAGLLEKEIISKTQYSGFKQIEKVYGYLYDPTGRKSFEIDTQGGITHYVYDQAGRLTESWSPETGKMVNNGKKTREALGLISTGPGPFEKMHLNSEENKALSDLWDTMPAAGHNHLKQNQNSWVERFTYDANGNRQTRETPLGTIEYSYSGSDHNRLTAEGNKRYEYDKAGNITKEILPTKETVFSYTEENRIASLISVSGKESVQVNYAYDGLGRRISQNSETRNNNQVTEVGQEGYSYQGTGMRMTSRFYETNPVSEGNAKKFLTSSEGTRFRNVDESGVSDRSYQQYHYGNGRVAVMSQNEVSATDLMGGRFTNSSPESRYYSTDTQGSVRGVTDEDAKEEASYQYSVFGEMTEGSFDDEFSVGYNGKMMDSATGLYNYGFRDYSPSTGRFTTVDPIRDSSNWYVLCSNDPVNYVDLWGLEQDDSAFGGYDSSYTNRVPDQYGHTSSYYDGLTEQLEQYYVPKNVDQHLLDKKLGFENLEGETGSMSCQTAALLDKYPGTTWKELEKAIDTSKADGSILKDGSPNNFDKLSQNIATATNSEYTYRNITKNKERVSMSKEDFIKSDYTEGISKQYNSTTRTNHFTSTTKQNGTLTQSDSLDPKRGSASGYKVAEVRPGQRVKNSTYNSSQSSYGYYKSSSF